jgi:hypothetical protein
MAKHVLTNAYITIDGTNVSDHVSQVTIEDSAEEVDLTGFGEPYREYGTGLKDANITATIFQDYAASSIDQLLYPLYSSGGTHSVVVRPTSSAKSATNPEYSMVSKLYSYSPLNGGVGEANTIDVSWRNAGTAGLLRGTA